MLYSFPLVLVCAACPGAGWFAVDCGGDGAAILPPGPEARALPLYFPLGLDRVALPLQSFPLCFVGHACCLFVAVVAPACYLVRVFGFEGDGSAILPSGKGARALPLYSPPESDRVALPLQSISPLGFSTQVSLMVVLFGLCVLVMLVVVCVMCCVLCVGVVVGGVVPEPQRDAQELLLCPS